MAYDLLIKNGLVVDGSGMPAFRGDVGVRNGKIAEIGKLSQNLSHICAERAGSILVEGAEVAGLWGSAPRDGRSMDLTVLDRLGLEERPHAAGAPIAS